MASAAPTARAPAGAVLATPAPAVPRRARPWRLLVLACLALAALSLLWPSAPTYDPWAWIIWGREILHGDLVTNTGPSWKPLPVLFTTPFSVLGDVGAPAAWLVVARAGGLLAVAMAWRLGARLAGPAAGTIAAASLLLADQFIRNFARGNSEGILVALCLWAVERHLDGRRRDAFLLGVAAAGLRPEIWPFIALYGAWLVARAWRSGGGPPAGREALFVGAWGVALVLVWFVPEYLGSGDFFRAASRARQPNPQSAAFADFPFLEVFRRSASVLSVPILAGGMIAFAAAAVAWRREGRGGLRLALAAVATVLMLAVALMTQFGFAGNLRYVALPAALVCVLAGAGWVELVRGAARRWGRRAALPLAVGVCLAAIPFLQADVRSLHAQWRNVLDESDFYGAGLRAVIAKAGGRERLLACGTVFTGPFQVQAVAWYLHLHGDQVEIWPFPPGTVLSPRKAHLAADPRFATRAIVGRWSMGDSCRT